MCPVGVRNSPTNSYFQNCIHVKSQWFLAPPSCFSEAQANFGELSERNIQDRLKVSHVTTSNTYMNHTMRLFLLYNRIP